MEQQLSAGLGEGQIPAFVEDDEVQAGEIVGDAVLDQVSMPVQIDRYRPCELFKLAKILVAQKLLEQKIDEMRSRQLVGSNRFEPSGQEIFFRSRLVVRWLHRREQYPAFLLQWSELRRNNQALFGLQRL
jgi:hypothetical protein